MVKAIQRWLVVAVLAQAAAWLSLQVYGQALNRMPWRRSHSMLYTRSVNPEATVGPSYAWQTIGDRGRLSPRRNLSQCLCRDILTKIH